MAMRSSKSSKMSIEEYECSLYKSFNVACKSEFFLNFLREGPCVTHKRQPRIARFWEAAGGKPPERAALRLNPGLPAACRGGDVRRPACRPCCSLSSPHRAGSGPGPPGL